MLFALRLTFEDHLTLADWDKLDGTLTEYLPSVELAGSASTASRAALVLSFREQTQSAAESRLAPLTEAIRDALGIGPTCHLA